MASSSTSIAAARMLTRTLRPFAAARTFRPSRYAYSIAIPTPSPSPSSSTSSLHSAASSFGSSSSLVKPQVIPPNPQVVRHLAEEEGLDEPELTPVEEAFVYVTPSAWNQLSKIGTRERKLTDGSAMLWFRVAVDSGGCHGYQYKMDLAPEPNGDDYTILPPSNLPPSSRPLPILIDPPSMEMLKGATVDFTTELIGSAFRVKENPQAKGSGCGCGVSWEAK